MAVSGFEVGKYYAWTGSKKDLDNWVEPMNAMLDGLPHKCTYVHGSMASFDGVPFCRWYWGHVLDRITEVKQDDVTITADEARRLVASGTECQWYDDDIHEWVDCGDTCAYQKQYKYRRKPTRVAIGDLGSCYPFLQGGIVECEPSLKMKIRSDILRELKKPIKERRRDIRKRFLGL